MDNPAKLTTDKVSCRIVASLLQRHGVKEAIVSPGSRNAPMIMALDACRDINLTVVVDERPAAFMALGMAISLQKPVALVCTSGTALLNYAPAIAEAYYRKAPLIVISADRPVEWIDQDDSQTLRQFEALANYVKGSYNIPADCDTATGEWYVNRIVNDAILTATSDCTGPVHINLQLDAPLGRTSQMNSGRWEERTIEMLSSSRAMSTADAERLGAQIDAAQKVLVIAGFQHSDPRLCDTLRHLSNRGNIVVMTETVANLSAPEFIGDIDAVLSSLDDAELEALRPDIVITFGGAIVSRFVKQYLRRFAPPQHWHVGLSHTTIDCFQALTLRVEVAPEYFFECIDSALDRLTHIDVVASTSDYHERWMSRADHARTLHRRFTDSAPWSDLVAVDTLFKALPEGVQLHLSNGTSVRYAQLFPPKGCLSCDCNRGVSGIDGCTSTAIGAALARPEAMTLLLTGDMCARYDVGALGVGCIPPTFRMVVLNNGGGGIFRFIDATRSMPILDQYLVADSPFPLGKIAEAYGMEYIEVASKAELEAALPLYFAPSQHPKVLSITTSGDVSASTLRDYFATR